MHVLHILVARNVGLTT